ncbi:MAG: hypothetical protein VB099_18175 [Candidatus Limiplasma sp.]|nr:hypothetical protein [Candidatus Limiplasma sp.]
MEVVLGFDTSCYTTSVAAVDRDGRVLGSQRMLLPVESGKRGLRQSEAVFAHVRQLPLVARELGQRLEPLSPRICAVAASASPREDGDSYMPVFLAGLGQGKALAALLGVPCYECSHQQGHIAAGQLGNPPLGERFVALHLSGGTTEMLLSSQGKLTLLGGSLDLQAGQLVDRVGVALGLPFPAGPELEKLALACQEPSARLLPVSFAKDGLSCHLSGAETQCQRWIAVGEMPQERIALEVFDFLARTVARLLIAGCKQEETAQALVVGGVASSLLLRELLDRRLRKAGSALKAVFGKPEFSADNAAGVAFLGARRHWGI